MLTSSLTLRQLLSSSANFTVEANFFVGRDRVTTRPLEMRGFEISASANSQVQTTGTASFIWADDAGRSISPRDLGDWLAPFAAYVEFTLFVSLSDVVESIHLGRFVVEEPEDPETSYYQLDEGRFVTSEEIVFQFSDLFSLTAREDLVTIEQPASRESVWDEIANLVGWPVVRTLGDAEIPADVTYKSSRLDAIYDLATVLGGVPEITPDVAVGMRPIAWPAPTFTVAADRITSWKAEGESSSEVYNQVVVRAEGSGDGEVLAESHLVTGRLRYGTPSSGAWGRFPLFVSDPYVTTREEAIELADRKLAEVSQQAAMTLSIDMHPDPTIQIGDVGYVDLDGDVAYVRVIETSFSIDPNGVESSLKVTRA